MRRENVSNRPSSQFLSILAVVAAVLCSPSDAYAAAQAKLALIATGFDHPDYVAVAPGERQLLFVVEQTGQIQVLHNDVKLATPFLDIRDIVSFGGERGLLSLAFAPDYPTSRRFYVAFTNKNGNVEVDEFQRSAASRTRAARGSRRILLVIPHPGAANHNGGQLQFGPDGYLYISVGDGGNVDPRGEAARDLHRLLGKILRIDPTPADGKPYGIPPDNPYVGTGNREEIYAYGLRNPWRFSFSGNRIAIGDVGQDTQEEVDFLLVADAKGANFGWPQYEGKRFYDKTRPGPDKPTFPMFVYPHTASRCAVIGGYVMHDANLPALDGRYLYADFCTGAIRSFIPDIVGQKALDDRPLGIRVPRLSSFGLGFNNVVYVIQRSGELSRLAPP